MQPALHRRSAWRLPPWGSACRAAAQNREFKEVKTQLTQVIEFLEPIERVDVSAMQEAGITRLSITLTPTKPLKK